MIAAKTAMIIGNQTSDHCNPIKAEADCVAFVPLNPVNELMKAGKIPPKAKPILKNNPITALMIPATRLPDVYSPYETTSGTKAHMNPVAEVNPHCCRKRPM